MKNNIKAIRKDLKLRQEDVAAMVGVTRQTIIAIENDRYNPSLELAMKLAKLLNTSVEVLFHLYCSLYLLNTATSILFSIDLL